MPYTLCTKNLKGLTDTAEPEESTEAPDELIPSESTADPYEAFKTQYTIEMIIDILHVINMVIIFCTAIKRDVVIVESCGEIAKAYIM
jgi:hypothetical protein